MKLKLIIFLLLGGIILASLLLIVQPAPTSKTPVALPINAAGQSPAFNEPPIVVTVTPTTATGSSGIGGGFLAITPTPTPQENTGAILVPEPVFDKEAYDELYKLLGSSKITTDAFTIQPNPQSRLVVITVNRPSDINMQKAFDWLKTNGYGNVPPKNLRFVEP